MRLLLDNDIRVVICTFAKSIERMTLSEMLFSLVDECHLSIAEVLILLSNSYRSSFQPHSVREMVGTTVVEAKQSSRETGRLCARYGRRSRGDQR